MKEDIIVAQLVYGGYVIGTKKADFLADVVQVILVDDGSGVPNVQIAPMLYPFNSELHGFTIEYSKIVCQMNCPAQLAASYTNHLNPSNIVMASEIPDDLKKKSKSKLKLV